MNDDQLIYYLCRDADVGRIVLLDNDFSDGIRSKLTERGATFDVVPERDFDEGRVEFDRSILNVVIKTNNLGLHAEPEKLRAHIESQVRDIQPFVDALGIYYGICGNYGWDIPKWAEGQGFKPTAVFVGDDGRVCDDCVSIAVGSSARYRDLERRYTGMFYLTPAIAENWVDFVAAGDGAEQLKNIPEETLEELGIHGQMDFMRWLFEIGHYEYILKLDTGFADTERFNRKAEEIGQALNLKPIEVEDGWVCARAAESIYERCKGFLS
ncbi:MAG: DUF1638 domain-containing protein [archaeon]|nr:DUF1638 domain-containing protein [archaeon]